MKLEPVNLVKAKYKRSMKTKSAGRKQRRIGEDEHIEHNSDKEL